MMGKLHNLVDSEANDFTLVVAWSGPEDKPFYRALLASQSRSSEIKNEPFWGYAVIGKKEFAGILDVLQNSKVACAEGPFVQGKPTYYVEIRSGDSVCHCLLGFDQSTLDVLGKIAGALEEANRKPILDIVDRISRSV
jgi:hypothetical protein